MRHEQNDPIWEAAWQWVQREHDREHFDDAARAEMVTWLMADPAHRQAYDKAAKLWLLSGLVPPAHDLGDCVEDTPDDHRESPSSKPDPHER